MMTRMEKKKEKKKLFQEKANNKPSFSLALQLKPEI